MVLVVVLALRGVRAARQAEILLHRRCMRAAGWLVVGFVASYSLKLALLGREALAQWSPAAIWTLRIHELCIAVMLAGGASALLRAAQLRNEPFAASAAGIERAPLSPGLLPALAAHRRSGWTALVGASLGVLTAGLVLAGMYARAVAG
jgi:hypothetical protein